MFIPRCLQGSARAGAGAPANDHVGFISRPSLAMGSNETAAPAIEQDEEPIKARSIDQRSAEPEEPRCVVCGRYGEYICDETDDDVCSLECKNVVLMCKNSSMPNQYEDECVVIRDGKPTLPEWEPDETISSLSAEQVAALRKGIDVSVKGESAPHPILEFTNCRLLPKLQENLTSAGYDTPTPIQMQAIPAALKGRDILVSSHTGSGKTLSFLLPIITRCSRIRMSRLAEGCLPLAIVLTPTRELCAQIEEQAKSLAKGLPFKTALVVGGAAMPQQVYRIRKGVELIVGTPGRLIDLLSKHEFNLGDVCMLVLDEVDCMLERGFRDQAMQIVQALSRPQIMLFSATVPAAIQSFCSSITNRLLVISAGQPSLPDKAVKQTIIWVESKNKKKKLFDILQSATHFQPPAVVFVNSRMGADILSDAIATVTGLSSASLHGQKPMSERREIMRSFLVGALPVVVATGVLGRGLDLLGVTQVIIFDMPNTLQEYTHQIGRASRMGVPGSAMVFINNESKGLFKQLVQLLRSNGVALPQQVLNCANVQQRSSGGAGGANKPRKRSHSKVR